jgi:hypothetical protein
MVNATPLPLYLQQAAGTHCIGGWVGLRAGLASLCGLLNQNLEVEKSWLAEGRMTVLHFSAGYHLYCQCHVQTGIKAHPTSFLTEADGSSFEASRNKTEEV